MENNKKDLNQFKKEYETLNNKLKELTDEELNTVTGGDYWDENIKYYVFENNEECYALEGIEGDGSNRTFFVCIDKQNQGLKPECVNCPAKNSKHYG